MKRKAYLLILFFGVSFAKTGTVMGACNGDTAYLPLSAGSNFPLSDTLYGTHAIFSGTIRANNVGIGIAPAAEKLLVNGDVSLVTQGRNYKVGTYAHFGETVAGYSTVLSNNARVNASATDRVDFAASGIDGNSAIVMNYARGMMFHVKPSGVSRTGGSQWFTVGDGTDEVMRLTPGRNVLIGTGSDDGVSKLQVKGNIRAQKMVVTQNSWSDYVFNADYRLKSLEEVDAFIKLNKHLPDIPSEKEIAKDGLNLGDSQALLLKKIEELTLYLIDIKKEVNTLKEENQKLRQLIKQ